MSLMMKKTVSIVVLALLASATLMPAQAGKKKKNRTDKPVIEAVVLNNGSDSLSYAAGMSITNGLVSYLQSQLQVDTAYMADFIEGFRQVTNADDDPRLTAHIAGLQIGSQIKRDMLKRMQEEFDGTTDSIVSNLVFRGFIDALKADTTVMLMPRAEALFTAKQKSNTEAKTAKLSEEGRRFLAENAKKPGVTVTSSGLQYIVLQKGTGAVPKSTDKVSVHYEGRLIDGTVFDASAKHGNQPAVFPVNGVIRGWTEALTLMPVGSKWRLFIPYELAYGERGAGQIPPYATLIFDVELVGIQDK